MFDILLTNEAREQPNSLKIDNGRSKRYRAEKKALQLLSDNPRHPGLRTHKFTTLKGQKGEKVLEAYAEQSTHRLHTGSFGIAVRKKMKLP